MKCVKCGQDVTPWYDGVKTVTTICSPCAVINLAEFLERSLPGDSIIQQSRGEQLGARLREIAAKSKRT
jgi:hypothetical protein